MSVVFDFAERVQKAFEPGYGGVSRVADQLLDVCGEDGLRLCWQDNQCRVCTLGPAPHESTEVTLPQSAFRAILARLAALCNERAPNTVSPYGGKGELALATNPKSIFCVAFVNQPGEAWLEIRRRHP